MTAAWNATHQGHLVPDITMAIRLSASDVANSAGRPQHASSPPPHRSPLVTLWFHASERPVLYRLTATCSIKNILFYFMSPFADSHGSARRLLRNRPIRLVEDGKQENRRTKKLLPRIDARLGSRKKPYPHGTAGMHSQPNCCTWAAFRRTESEHVPASSPHHAFNGTHGDSEPRPAPRDEGFARQ